MANRIIFGLLLSLSAPRPAAAAGRVIALDGRLTSGGAVMNVGDELPDTEINLASGTATFAIAGGRFLATGPARFTPRKSSIFLQLGGLLSALKKLGRRRFSVRTPTVVAAVRGTDFYVAVAADKTVDVCICRGALQVTGKGMAPLPMAATHHLNYSFARTPTGIKRQISPMSGHTDAQVIALHALLDRASP